MVDEIDQDLARICREIDANEVESDMVSSHALQLLANLGALDEETRRDYVRSLRAMCNGEYDWPEI